MRLISIFTCLPFSLKSSMICMSVVITKAVSGNIFYQGKGADVDG